ncbi:hypothetical protein F441_14330 [Phytophthora nicotianae CJ01A1]|uniref:Uncharacterized protein n=2 Tax=Phytophthora nicotianae TaxID=4792 RepID=W2WH92_PHYNI|nr:hypothetical protein L915_14100 [Phytophthora nicotianae]ETP09876.1 hypothetical protein F441_14330 [Phytophthora nicotianae CJ01A1]
MMLRAVVARFNQAQSARKLALLSPTHKAPNMVVMPSPMDQQARHAGIRLEAIRTPKEY